ncbi:coiled-coil domain-containing protein 134 [Nasonia vitripennis]|uniref:Coiled-coil domain-containing protein 134 n=1 Tax=Nasonia vitripennis TaxID=7425 RepID=A0A7M7G9D9_NASVI|nr:coiled-coil domain-containing protein 134 [Nasonia vitripennis]
MIRDNMAVAGKFRQRLAAARLVVGVIVVALALLGAPTARARDDVEPIAEEETPARENLNSVNRELFKRLFVKRRKEHLEAVRNLRQMDSYERQYKMINVLADKMFDLIESKKPLLENFTEADLRSVSFAVDAKNDVQDAISSVLENVALFGDVVLNLPDITQRILKTQPRWNATMRWSFDFLNRTKDLLDKSTLEMIELALQELNITDRSPNYFNPNRIGNKPSRSSNKEPKLATKKEKGKKGPTMTRIEL